MKKSSLEGTQGARLDKAKDLSSHIQSFVNFNPPHDSDQASNFAAVVEALEESVINFALAAQQYRLATEQRKKLFRDNDFSALKILKYIRAIAEVHFGQESRQLAIIAGAINEIRPSGKHKKKKETEAEEAETKEDVAPIVAEDATSEEDSAEEKVEKRVISQSHQSYPSMALTFHKIVEMMATIPYQSNTPELQIGALQQLARSLSQANREIAQSIAAMDNAQRRCKELDEQVSASVVRIKGYIKYAYGANSTEYLTIK